MPSAHWTCPQCGRLYHPDESACSTCRITRDHRDVVGRTSVEKPIEKPAEAVEVHLPYAIPDASFNLVMPGGKTVWTGGWVAAGEAGLFLVGAKDGLAPKEVAKLRPRRATAVGPTSVYFPPSAIARIVHEPHIGQFLELNDGKKIPLRLPKEAWEELDALCDHFGILHT